MTQKRFETGKTAVISIAECHGDLVVRSWMESAVQAKGDQFEVNESETGLSFTSQSDLRLMVPADTSLSVVHTNGDLIVKNITGDVSLGEVSGDAVLLGVNNVKINTIHNDLSAKSVDGNFNADTINGDAVLRNVSTVSINTIQGDISARYINGTIYLGKVAGDASLHTVNGDLTLDEGHRDVNLRNLGGRNTVKRAHGDIRLQGGLAAGEHTFTADGDIILRWPATAPLNLVATAPQIVNRLELDKAAQEGNTLTGRLGDGETSLTLNAGRRITLKDTQLVRDEWGPFQAEDADFGFNLDLDLAGLGEQISAQINEQVARAQTVFESKFGPDFAQRMAEKIARKAEKAAERAEQAAERARRRAEQQMRHSSHRPYPSAPPTPPTSPHKKKASSEEQLKILRMVEKGVISPDEATLLLDALEN